jgi:hypothetical protein
MLAFPRLRRVCDAGDGFGSEPEVEAVTAENKLNAFAFQSNPIVMLSAQLLLSPSSFIVVVSFFDDGTLGQACRQAP